jgi:Uma2 family endonuclease
MPKRLTVDEYFRLPESNRPMELAYGFVREPPSPFYSHQSVVGKIFTILTRHVQRYQLGVVCMSPLDVVLDQNKERAIVVQPDVFFVSADRLDILRDRVWGPPDLAVEVLSPGTARRDKTVKLDWYRRYGVKECWIVDARKTTVEVIDLKANSRKIFTRGQRIRSAVLPRLATPVHRLW